ncbi:TK/KIN6 protein kinase [Apostichopus japonicus]|uniref:TK/KIN6 protein kinase n=1 Tax=Stichopus japonicus TaxID=307972 RepID=A0A2G8LJ84_STIJA|nr:TK/KIN6 protein kinase [Apostichopus japonicus]
MNREWKPLVQIKKDTEIVSAELEFETRTASNETVQCEVTEAIAPFNITWIINGVRNRSYAVKNESHFTSTLTFHPTDKTSLICQVQGPSIETKSVNISLFRAAPSNLTVRQPLKGQRSYTTNIKPPSRQTNSDNDDTAQGMTDNPVYDGVSDHDEHANKDSPTENVNVQDEYQTTLAICLKTSRMFEYWSATYTKGENKDVKCFAKTLSVPYSIFYEQLDGGSLRDFMMTHYQGARESHAASTGTGNQDFLQEKMKTELQELIYFASNINKGLRFLSGQKFCHPALCLKKVLLSSVGQCKLYDICPLTSAMRKVEELMKKERPPIAWMPPETIFMQEYYQASDVWGYAVLLWELFSFGEIPLARVSDSEIEKQIRGGFILPQPLCCPGAVDSLQIRNHFITTMKKLMFVSFETFFTFSSQREQPPIPAERNQDTAESNPVTDVEESAHSTSYVVLESKFQTNEYV